MPQHLQMEMEKLKRKLLFESALVEERLCQAVQAVRERDGRLAARIIDADMEIDRTEVELEEECLKLLALYQPVAADLRFIIAAIKINSDLERIGDLAVNIAEHAAFLAVREPLEIPATLSTMLDNARAMLHGAIDSLVNRDAALARRILAADQEVDDLNRDTFSEVEERIRQTPDKLESLIRLLSISRQIERVGDHATNIAEDVIYMVEGEIVRHQISRPAK